MSDIEPDDEGLAENPEPEADAPEEADAPPESEAESTTESQASANVAESSQPGSLGANTTNQAESGEARVHIHEGNEENENNCLAEGDQDQLRGDLDDTANNNGDLVEDGGATASNEMQVSLEAEDEQYYNSNNECDFAGAEWSLEPEENSLNCVGFAGPGGEAEGIVNREDVCEAEQSSYNGCVAAHHRTESSCQMDQGVLDNSGAESVGDNSEYNNTATEADGASACMDDRSQHRSGARLEHDQVDEVNFVAEQENEPTESDEEVASNRCLASDGRNIQNPGNDLNVNTNAESESVYAQAESDAVTRSPGRNLVSPNSSTAENGSTLGEQNVPEDEISVASSVGLKTDMSLSFQPECDQSAINNCQSISSQNPEGESEIYSNRTSSASGNSHVEQARDDRDSTAACIDNRDRNVNLECESSQRVPQVINASPANSPHKHSDAGNKATSQSFKSTTMPESDMVALDTSDTRSLVRNTQIDDQPSLGVDSETGGMQNQPVESGINSRFDNTAKSSNGVAKPATSKEIQFIVNKVEQSQTDRKPRVNGPVADIDSEEELLSELDATLKCSETDPKSVNEDPKKYAISNQEAVADEEDFSCEQCLRNNLKCSLKRNRPVLKEGSQNIPETKDLKRQMHQAKQLLLDRECEISRLKEDLNDYKERLESLSQDRDNALKEMECLKHQNSDDLYIPQIKELEYTIAQQQNEVRSFKDKLSSHDTAAKRAIATLQNEMKLRIDQVTKMYEEANREKDSMVVKYAQAEHKNLEYQKQAERAEAKLRDMEKERDSFMVKMRAIKEHRTKVGAELDARVSELNSVNKELDKHREMLASADVRVKWAQNKLKAELDAHKETKLQLEKMHIKLKEAKEETQQIRQDCQAIIKTYQESEEVKSNSLDKELKQKETELLVNLQEKTNFELAHVKTQRELEHVKGELRDSKMQCGSLAEKIAGLEGEKEKLTSTMNKYSEIIQKQKKEIQELRERIETLVQYRSDFTRAQELIKTLDTEIADLKISNKDLVAEMEACRKRETDKLELTAKLSRKNAELQSENTTLSNKLLNLTGELQTSKMDSQSVDTKLKELSDALASEQKLRQEETQSLNTRLAGKTKAVEDLTRKLEEEKDEIKTLKRKHANNVKDLTRQLQQVRKRMENYETNGERDTVSMGSRTSSSGSLNTLGVTDPTSTMVVQPNSSISSSGSSSSHNSQSANMNPVHQHKTAAQEQEFQVITEQVEVDKQTLIERIVKLQRAMARKSEKLEFMEDHISQLVDEIQKKNRIIQSYVMREETGTMTSNSRDFAKAEISRKHSIMGSVYSSHSNDGTMTLDLSLEINRKLQAVLEDTLLKNMTLKESLDTLGQEIARLSQENRSLQLQIQGKGRQRGNPARR